MGFRGLLRDIGRAGQKVEPFQRLSRSYIKVPLLNNLTSCSVFSNSE
jgi:hypothetical protein